MTFSVAIKHVSHNGRASIVSRLRREFDAKVVLEQGNGVWDTARRAWKAVKPDVTHHLVLDDDMLLKNKDHLQSAFGTNPSHLCMGLPGGAFCLPVHFINEFLEWCDDNIRHNYPHDDARLLLWAWKTGKVIEELDIFTQAPTISMTKYRPSRRPSLERAWRFASKSVTDFDISDVVGDDV